MPGVTRALDLEDVKALMALYIENRRFLAPWQPLRPESSSTSGRPAQGGPGGPGAPGSRCSRLLGLERRRRGRGHADRSLRSSGGPSRHAASATGWRSALKGRGWRPRRCGRPSASPSETFACTAGAGRDAHAQPAQRVFQRVGFEHYGVARSYVHIAGRWQDNVLYQLLTPAPPDGS